MQPFSLLRITAWVLVSARHQSATFFLMHFMSLLSILTNTFSTYDPSVLLSSAIACALFDERSGV